jgi:uracil-DNA glycosylase family 4
MTSEGEFKQLSRNIVTCEKCPRLRAYARVEAKKKRPRFAEWDYWARPVPGFGDLNGRLLVLGLAPAATGALRTGRIFTGDASSAFLVGALYSAGYANQARSESLNDGLVYADCYVTAAVKCAPPGDKPTAEEFANCAPYLDKEIALMGNLEAVLALGAFAFKAYLGHLARNDVGVRGLKFAHGKVYGFPGMPTLYASYHPSPRNTNTGRLTQRMLVKVLHKVRSDLARDK